MRHAVDEIRVRNEKNASSDLKACVTLSQHTPVLHRLSRSVITIMRTASRDTSYHEGVSTSRFLAKDSARGSEAFRFNDFKNPS